VGTTIVGAINVLATYVAMRMMDSCGRRTLILWSSGGMFLCCVIIVLSLLGFFSNMLAFVAVCIYVSFFELGLGPIPWLVVSEMVRTKVCFGSMLLGWVIIGGRLDLIGHRLSNHMFQHHYL
jgi:MFS transporter, SP family, solute carrier family 2 (facilitated glucose transporter), member 3